MVCRNRFAAGSNRLALNTFGWLSDQGPSEPGFLGGGGDNGYVSEIHGGLNSGEKAGGIHTVIIGYDNFA